MAAIEAATDVGADGRDRSVRVELPRRRRRMPEVVAAVTRAAFANGATHLSLHVARTPDGGAP